MSKKIVIIGANDSINNLIVRAKEKGYETHVFAWKCGDVGEKTADFFYPISVDKKDEILDECKKICPDGIASVTSDFAAPVVNYLSRALNLTCNSEKTDLIARNKFEMRRAFKAAGLYVPRFVRVDSTFDVKDFPLTFPVIVKPTDRWSSKGVTRVDEASQLKSAIDEAAGLSLEKHAIVEEFMDGPEYSCECISYRGTHKALTITQKLTTGYPHYIETGHIQPSDLSEEKQQQVFAVVYKALDALEIRNGASHAEFRVLKNGEIGIIEIGARMGGDYIGTDLVRLSTGYDYLGMVIDVACGKEPDFTKVCVPHRAQIKFLVTEDDYDEYKRMEKNGVHIVKQMINADRTCAVTDSSTRHGFYIFIS